MFGMNSVAFEQSITVLTIENASADTGYLGEIFKGISDAGVNLDMISQTAPTGRNVTLSFSMDDEDLQKALKVIGVARETQPEIACEVSSDNMKVVFYDKGMPEKCGIAGQIFEIFNRAGVPVKLVTTSSDTVSVLFDRYHEAELRAEIERSVEIR